jgi:RNA polymerase sigma-70 factor (ECF subfamily)
MDNLEKKFSLLYDQYVNRIYRFILIKVSSKEVAEDLCSETFLRAWQTFKKAGNPGHFNEIKNPSAFLYQIARNLVVDYYREKDKIKLVSLENSNPVSSTSLENKIFLNSDLEQVRKALNKLNDDYQNLIIWHYLDELSIAEISEILNKKEGAVRVQLHRAIKALREECNKKEINTS